MSLRKIILLMITVLVGVYLLLSLLNLGSEFTAEKLFYKTLKSYYSLPEEIDETSLGMQTFLTENLRKIIKRFPRGQTAKNAYLQLIAINLKAKKYDKVILIADEIIKRYKVDVYLASKAQFIKGNTYEKMGHWDKALEEYKILQNTYPTMPIGLQIPFHIVAHYKKNNDIPKADKAVEDAVLHFNKVKDEYSGKPAGYAASKYLVESYIMQKDYRKAAGALEDIVSAYPVEAALRMLPYVDLIFVKKLERPSEALEIYEYFLKKTDDEKIVNYLNKKIQSLQ